MMLVEILRKLRRSTRGTRLGAVARRLGVTALGKAVYNRRMLARGVHECVLMDRPVRFSVTSGSEVTRIDGGVEVEFVRRLLGALRDGDVFFDVGANIGIVTVLVAARPEGRRLDVRAFEPEPRNVERLRANVALNDLSRVTVHKLALGRESTTALLYISGAPGTGTHSTLASQSNGRDAVPVRVETAAAFSHRHGVLPDVLKIDVEGAEMDVLSGMEAILGDVRPAGAEANDDDDDRGPARTHFVRELLIEVHPGPLAAAGSSEEALVRWLAAYGFDCVWQSRRADEVHRHFARASVPGVQPQGSHASGPGRLQPPGVDA
jgi:FkbM family methyltransferase